jgi:dephospho-CoA kinase
MRFRKKLDTLNAGAVNPHQRGENVATRQYLHFWPRLSRFRYRGASASGILNFVKVIGLTGVIGSGKSTVAGLLEQLGAKVIDADRVAHEVYAPGTTGWHEVISAFGRNILSQDGMIDRRKLGKIVFAEPAARARINNIIHPLVKQKVLRLLKKYRDEGTSVAVIEAALLIEAGWVPMLDELWVTTAPREIIYKRLKARDNAARQQVLARLRSQLPVAQQRRLATHVIATDTDLGDLRRKIAVLWLKTSSGPTAYNVP